MKDDCTTNSHYPTSHISLSKVGRMYFLNLGVKGLRLQEALTSCAHRAPSGNSVKNAIATCRDIYFCLMTTGHDWQSSHKNEGNTVSYDAGVAQSSSREALIGEGKNQVATSSTVMNYRFLDDNPNYVMSTFPGRRSTETSWMRTWRWASHSQVPIANVLPTLSREMPKWGSEKSVVWSSFIWVSYEKLSRLHTVWCNISGEAAGEVWNCSLLGVKGLNADLFLEAEKRFAVGQARLSCRGQTGGFHWPFHSLVPKVHSPNILKRNV